MNNSQYFAFLYLFLLLSFPLHAQWAKTYGSASDESCRNILATVDGGFIIAGHSLPAPGSESTRGVWISKFSSNGDIQWAHSLGRNLFPIWDPPAMSVRLEAVEKTESGSFILTGDAGWTLDPEWTGGPGETGEGPNQVLDLFVIQIASDGQVLWKRQFGKKSRSAGSTVKAYKNGDFIVGGFVSIANKKNDAWIFKLDLNGDLVWEKTLGGSEDDEIYSLQVEEDGGCLALGRTASFGMGGSDVWLIKLDSQGEIVWQQTYGGIENEQGYSLEKTNDGGFIIAGEISSDIENRKAWIVKIDLEGKILWQKKFGKDIDCLVQNVIQTSDGGFAVAGTFFNTGTSDFLVVKLTASGSIEWNRTFGSEGNEIAYALDVISENKYVIVGDTDYLGENPLNALILSFSPEEGMPDCKYYGQIELDSENTLIVPLESNASVHPVPTFIVEPEIHQFLILKANLVCPHSRQKGKGPIR